MSDSGVSRLIKGVYDLLGLQTYLTTGEKETRAWTIVKGMKAPQAAGVIHSDFERGFIAGEIVHYPDLVELGTYAKCREKGKLRIEGKEYVMTKTALRSRSGASTVLISSSGGAFCACAFLDSVLHLRTPRLNNARSAELQFCRAAGFQQPGRVSCLHPAACPVEGPPILNARVAPRESAA